MGIEIERKFLVSGSFPEGEKQYHIKQGYINPLRCAVKISGDMMFFLYDGDHIALQKDIGNDSKKLLKDIPNDGKGLLLLDDHNLVRIRTRDYKGFITIKGLTGPLGTPEYEYDIPASLAKGLLDRFADRYLTKLRNIITFKDKKWEVDEFTSPINLTLAEVELNDIHEDLIIPSWIGKEVTGDFRYSNSEIIKMTGYNVKTQEFTS
jgi:CYTH domain-containing protein